METTTTEPPATPTPLRHVVLASSLGALFEWYDFYLYGSLAAIIARQFFSGLNAGSAFIVALLAFAAGFVVRPLGSLVFGHLGDLAGRKYTFLITLVIMGLSTFLVGVLPTYASVGLVAPVALVVLRMLQGLAIGGEYGGAATYVAEHVPSERRGLATSWIQTTGSFGLLLSLIVIIGCRQALGPAFDVWGWRVPFLLSGVLLAVSIYIRLRLQESPVFEAMRREGTTARAPLREAFANRHNAWLVLRTLFGVAIGQAMIVYACEIYTLYFLTIDLRIEATTASALLAGGLVLGTPLTLVAGALADRIGRKPVVLVGCVIAASTFFPVFHALEHFGNPALEQATRSAPVVVVADPADCHVLFDPIGKAKYRSSCDIARLALAERGIPYRHVTTTLPGVAEVRVGAVTVGAFSGAGLDAGAFEVARRAFRDRLGDAVDAAGYPHAADPAAINLGAMLGLVTLLIAYVSVVYGPLAAWLVELFPARIRYSAISLPYHVGFGWFGGFLPAISFAIVASTGDSFAGLWYPVGLALVSAAIGWAAVPETLGREPAGRE